MVIDDPFLASWGLDDYLSTGVGWTSVHTNESARTEFVRPGESYTVYGFNTVENDATKEAPDGLEKPQDWSDWLFSDTWSQPHNDYDPTSNSNYNFRLNSEDEGLPELSEDFVTYDGEIGKRLNHMDSIPHVPRINGEIPTVDDASTAHQRLLDRLKLYGLHEIKVDGDGNCQFRAFSDQLYRTPIHHKAVRDDVVTQLTSHPEFYEEYVPMNYTDYVKKMAMSGEWGDHVTLQAAADFYGVRICLLTSFKDTSFVQILPRQMKSKKVVFLSFWAEVHYNSLYADGGAPLYLKMRRRTGIGGNFLKTSLKFETVLTSNIRI